MSISTDELNCYSGNALRETQCQTKTWLIGGGIALAVILAIGAVVVAYFVNPSFHTFANNTFSHIQYDQISVGQGLLYIGLPTGAAAILLGLAICIYKRHRERKKTDLFGEGHLRELRNTIKSLRPKGKQLIIGTVVLAILAAVAVGLYFCPSAHQWMSQALTNKLLLWQGIVYIGGAAAGSVLLLGLSYIICNKIAEAAKKEEKDSFCRSKKPEDIPDGDL